jgi:hypothetical protein
LPPRVSRVWFRSAFWGCSLQTNRGYIAVCPFAILSSSMMLANAMLLGSVSTLGFVSLSKSVTSLSLGLDFLVDQMYCRT